MRLASRGGIRQDRRRRMKSAPLAWLVRLITGVRLAADPGGPDRPRIYFANHSSHLDFVVIWSALPGRLRKRARPVAAADYWDAGPLRRWLASRVFHAVLVPRGKLCRGDDPIGCMTAVLEEGNDLILFPEGTRSVDGRVGEFRSGLHALALRHPEAELVPVHLENLNRILPKGEVLFLPILGTATFGSCCAGPAEGEHRHDFLRRARAALLELSHHPVDSPEDPDEPRP